jgi:dTDP-4-amino-4,6-dideoxygalactose transaminase
MKIPITKPFFDEREREALAEPLSTGWIVQGPKVKAFEEAIRAYTAVQFARATTSCTTALHLALIACGVDAGDEVILPSFTFVASANAVEYLGAKPVFVDIDLETFNIDVSQVEAAVTAHTKAIMPVHLFGLCADMEPLMEIAIRHRLQVVEDAACAIGGFYRGAHAGTIGNAGCLSFHPRKSITTGEGGMVLTDDSAICHRVEILRDHGAEISDLARHEGKGLLLPEYNVLGYNYRMTDLQGALGVAQMQKLAHILERKRTLAEHYTDMLRQPGWLKPPTVPPGFVHGYQTYACLVQPESFTGMTSDRLETLRGKRDSLMERLNQEGISTRQGTHAVHALGYYRKKYGYDAWDFPSSWIAENLTLALPLYPQMTDEEHSFVCSTLRKNLNG